MQSVRKELTAKASKYGDVRSNANKSSVMHHIPAIQQSIKKIPFLSKDYGTMAKIELNEKRNLLIGLIAELPVIH